MKIDVDNVAYQKFLEYVVGVFFTSPFSVDKVVKTLLPRRGRIFVDIEIPVFVNKPRKGRYVMAVIQPMSLLWSLEIHCCARVYSHHVPNGTWQPCESPVACVESL